MENGCTHTPIALAVFGTKLFRTLQSRETHIGVGGLWGGREGERWHFFGALAKVDVSFSIALAGREFLPKSCLLIKINIRPSVTYRQRPFCKIPYIRFFLVYQSLCLTFCVGVTKEMQLFVIGWGLLRPQDKWRLSWVISVTEQAFN